jgi:uncharacterized protein involved in outer membrane biogenesis
MTRIFGTVTAVILGLIALCGGLVVMAGGALTLMEGKRLADITAWAATRLAGRQVAIEGPVTIDWGRPTILTAYGVSVANPDWASYPDLLEVATLRVGVDPVSLLKLDPSIPLLDIQKPRAFLERNEADVPSWQGLTGFGGQQSPEPGLDLYGLQELRLVDGTVTYRNAGSATLPYAHLSNLRIEATDAASPISVQGTAQLSDPIPDGAPPLQVSGSIMSLNDLRMKGAADGDGAPVKITVLAAESEITAEGQLTDPFGARKLDVRLAGSGPDAGTLLQYFGMRTSRQPDWRVEADVSGSPPQWQLGNIVANLGGTSIRGTAGFDLSGAKPMIRADLDVGHLALDELRALAPSSPGGNAAQSGTASENAGDGGVIPDTSLPFDLLKAADARISVRVAELSGTGLPIGNLTAEVTVDKGVLKVQPVTVDFAEGQTRTTATLDANARPPALHAQVSAQRISSDALLTSLGVTQKVQGLASGEMTLDSAGNTPDALAAGLDGQVQFYITDGRINTKLVNALALSFTEVMDLLFSSDDSTPVDCMIGSFDVTDGIVDPETLIFATPEVAIRGKGRIDLAEETVELRFTPRPRERRFFSISVPIEMSGTLAHPTIDLGASLGAELARNKACQRALDRVSGS